MWSRFCNKDDLLDIRQLSKGLPEIDSLMAEALALEECFSMAKDTEADNLDIQVDSELLVNYINRALNCDRPISPITENCRHLFQEGKSLPHGLRRQPSCRQVWVSLHLIGGTLTTFCLPQGVSMRIFHIAGELQCSISRIYCT